MEQPARMNALPSLGKGALSKYAVENAPAASE
jgi:hypothetical protein